MNFKIRVETLEATNQVAVYIKEGNAHLRLDGAPLAFTHQLLRDGETPEPALVLSKEIAQGIAEAMTPAARPDDANELLTTLRTQHKEDKVAIAWMQAIITKIVGLQGATEEEEGCK